jgi:hypothetical protein
MHSNQAGHLPVIVQARDALDLAGRAAEMLQDIPDPGDSRVGEAQDTAYEAMELALTGLLGAVEAGTVPVADAYADDQAHETSRMVIPPAEAVAYVRDLDPGSFDAVRDAIRYWDDADYAGEDEAAEMARAAGRTVPDAEDDGLDLGRAGPWTFDPAREVWRRRTGPNAWAEVPGDLASPPSAAPDTERAMRLSLPAAGREARAWQDIARHVTASEVRNLVTLARNAHPHPLETQDEIALHATADEIDSWLDWHGV